MHDVDAAQPGGRRETGDVGGRATAQADQRVLAADSDAAQHFPQEADDREVLAVLGVRDFDAVRVNTLVRQPLSDHLGGLGEYGLVHDGDLVPGAEQFVQLAQQPGADDHRVGRVDGHLHGHRFAGGSHVAARQASVAGSRDTM